MTTRAVLSKVRSLRMFSTHSSSVTNCVDFFSLSPQQQDAAFPEFSQRIKDLPLDQVPNSRIIPELVQYLNQKATPPAHSINCFLQLHQWAQTQALQKELTESTILTILQSNLQFSTQSPATDLLRVQAASLLLLQTLDFSALTLSQVEALYQTLDQFLRHANSPAALAGAAFNCLSQVLESQSGQTYLEHNRYTLEEFSFFLQSSQTREIQSAACFALATALAPESPLIQTQAFETKILQPIMALVAVPATAEGAALVIAHSVRKHPENQKMLREQHGLTLLGKMLTSSDGNGGEQQRAALFALVCAVQGNRENLQAITDLSDHFASIQVSSKADHTSKHYAKLLLDQVENQM